MKQYDNKSKIWAEDLEQFRNELATMDRIAKLMGDIDTIPKKLQGAKENY